MTDKQKNYYSGYDIDQTIEFTKDDLKNLRQPNRQPIDEDYFSKQIYQSENNEKVEVQEPQKKEKLVDENIVENDNPFRYKSKVAELRAAKEEEKRKAQQLAKEKREQFKRKFEDPYQQVYNENEFDSIEDYNQFETQKVDEENNKISLTQFFNRLTKGLQKKNNETIDKFETIEEQYSNLEDELFLNEEIELKDRIDDEEIVDNAIDDVHQGDRFEVNAEELVDEELTEWEEEMILTDAHLDEVLVNEELLLNEPSQEEISFVKGTAWLTAGNIISRVLGALYVIPWGTWFGTNFTTANVLYSIGYNPYSLFLAISTGGFPSAIAKQIAFYHSRKEYKTADRIFKYSLLMMLISGVLSAVLLFVLAPYIANISSTDNPGAATIVIRSLAPALLILPIMSLLRGYFQGFGDMIPTAISQILEQIARVVYMLAATYGIMKIWSGNVTSAVAHSTFAAFIGAFLSLIYLVYLYVRRLPLINLLQEESKETVTINFKTSLAILLKDSIPFILLGSGIIIAKFIDQLTFKFILEKTSILLLSDISKLFGVLNLDVDKLIMIIISIAVGMSLSSIPLITSLFANREEDKVASLIEKIILLFLLVMLPAAFGMASIANNMYQFFYPYGHEIGPSLLVTASYLSIILGAYTILSTIIQSMNYRRAAIKYLTIGLIVKLVVQFPLVAWLQAHGALIATLIAFLVVSILMLLKIHLLVGLHFREMSLDFVIILVATLLMAISASFWNSTLDLLLGDVGRLLIFVKIILVILLSTFTYLSILGLFGKLSLLLGSRYQAFQDKVRMF